MAVEKLPNLNPPDLGSLADPGRPTLCFAWRKAGPHRVAAHQHPRAHIIQPEQGAYWVLVNEGRWLVARGQAAWIPSHVPHEIYSHGTAAARMIFVDESHATALPGRSGVAVVTPLLEQLTARAMEYGNYYARNGRAARLANVMLDELAALTYAPLFLPAARDPRLVRAMEYIVANVGVELGAEEVGWEVGASTRTLARLFRDETGMTMGQWRTRLVLIEAIDRLARGVSVTKVALDLGYSSPSSFAYMFRSNLGCAPSQY